MAISLLKMIIGVVAEIGRCQLVSGGEMALIEFCNGLVCWPIIYSMKILCSEVNTPGKSDRIIPDFKQKPKGMTAGSDIIDGVGFGDERFSMDSLR